MCLSIPGEVLDISFEGEIKMGKVNFAGIGKQVCLQYLPDVKVGDYVLVHVGFAIAVVQEEEAAKTLALLREMGEVQKELEGGDPPSNT